MSSLLESILGTGALELRFQPIIGYQSTRCSTYAFECLTRGPRDTSVHDAAVLFEYVRRKRAERLVDRLCVSNAFACVPDLAPYSVSINIHGSTLSADPDFSRDVIDAAARAGVDPQDIIIEVVEQCGVLNDAQFRRSVSALHDAGFRIAVDDFGMGHSNFKMILESRPDFFKIDRYFVSGVPDDTSRAAVIESMVELAAKLGARVIAEGVESLHVEGVLRLLGVELLQGYLYARPLSLSDARSFAAGGGGRLTHGGHADEPE